MQKILKSRITTLVLIALVMVLAIHVLAENGEHVRLDLTADDLYSLSEGTEMILDRMNEEGAEPIHATLYFSETVGKTLPRFIKDFITYQKYMEALLEEFAVASDGKVRVSYVDPEPDSDEAQDALDFGLDGKPVNQHGDLFFFGLVLETRTGSREVIDFLWPAKQETIEYEISKRIHGLTWPERQRVGVLSSLDVISEAANPYMRQILQAQGRNPGDSWMSMQLLEEQYEVAKIPTDTDRIDPEEFDLVLVVHPKNLGQRALWALDEWVVRGGNTLVFLDPYAIADEPPPAANPQQQSFQQFQYKPSSNLDPLLSNWGLERQEDQVAADFDLAVVRPVARRGGSGRMLVDLAIDEGNREKTLATDHPILQGVNDLRLFLPGVLVEKWDQEDAAGAEILREPLVTTTPKGNSIEIVPGFPDGEKLVFTDLNTPEKIADIFVPGNEPLAIAYLVQGRLPSLYPDGVELPEAPPAPPPGLPPGVELPPPPNAETVRKEPVAEAERASATVVVFADVDLISDPVAFQQSPFGPLPANDNHKVLLNSVDYLFGSEALMKVRSKSSIRRPFTLFEEIEAQADAQTLERERELRAEIEGTEEALRERQRSIAGENAALFQKQLQDEIDALNAKIRAAEAELREIRQEKRAALEGEEARVRFAAMGLTPALVLILGLVLFVRRRMRDQQARRSRT